MTFEQRTLIDLSDIVGVEFECHACKAKVALSSNAERTMFWECPVCNRDWLDQDTEEGRTIQSFVNLVLKSIARKLDGRAFSLRLQIPLTKQSASQTSTGQQ
jgi:hypothetical protein